MKFCIPYQYYLICLCKQVYFLKNGKMQMSPHCTKKGPRIYYLTIDRDYRPISLLSCVGKLFEKVIFKYTFNFIRDNNLITTKQSGFKPGDSTVYQLTHVYHLFAEALDKKKDARIVFCDISKAFDRVWHAGLLHKLEKLA